MATAWIYWIRRQYAGIFHWLWFRPQVSMFDRVLSQTGRWTHYVPVFFKLLYSLADWIHSVWKQSSQSFQRVVPILGQGQHFNEYSLCFRGQPPVLEHTVCYDRKISVFAYSEYRHFFTPFSGTQKRVSQKNFNLPFCYIYFYLSWFIWRFLCQDSSSLMMTSCIFCGV